MLNGHRHHDERFAPQTPDGALDLERGIREFVVGTGSGSVPLPTTGAADSEVLSTASGVINLTPSPDSYTWEFIPVAGGTFTDSGSGTCH